MSEPTLRDRLGVRGLGLILIWVTWSMIGVGVYQDVAVTVSGAPHLLIPIDVRAGLWIGSGTLALVLCTSRRWDRLALIGAVIMPVVRVTSYAWAWVTYLAPGGVEGYPSGWYNAAIHSVLVGFVLLVAAIVDVPAPASRDEQDQS